MPYSPQDHADKAKENELLADSLGSSPSTVEWAITATFYAAVHYVQSYLVKNGNDPARHSSRRRVYLADPKVSMIDNDYQELMDKSVLARYHVMHLDVAELARAKALLQSIKNVVIPLL